MGITELSNAYVLCTCGAACSRACTVCSSVTWLKGPCVQQLWRDHLARRFDDILRQQVNKPPLNVCRQAGCTDPSEAQSYYCATHFKQQHGISYAEATLPTDAEIVERTIDFAEQLGMYLEPWQAAALRAILLHGGDVAIGR